MAKKSHARLTKQMEERRTAKLALHVEAMGAAFCKATGTDPSKAALRVVQNKDGSLKYWYEEHAEPSAEAASEMEVKEMFTLLMDVAKYHDSTGLFPEIVENVKRFLSRYEE